MTNSTPQQLVDHILDNNGINYIREKGIKYYSIDNYISDKLMIEVQGDYWHSNPLKFNTKINKVQYDRITKDKAKHTYVLKIYNTEILYLWESDILNNLELCEKLILAYINNDGVLQNYNSFNYHINNGKLTLNNNIVNPYYEMELEKYRHLYQQIS